MTDEQKRRSIPVLKLLWRFGTGLHMDGKRRMNMKTKKVLPQYRDYYWNRYSRTRKMVWRHGLLWPTLAIGYGLVVDFAITANCLMALIPFVLVWFLRKLLNHVARRMKHVDTDGVEEIYWTLRPKYSRLLRKLGRVRIKLHGPTSEPVPANEAKAIHAQLGEEGIGDVRQLRRPLEPPKDLSELLAEHPPKTSREKTLRRSANRRLPK